ncbi:MAG: hypothetical protein ABR517_01900 [Thermoanaerobaculia bacterium]
MSPAPGRVTVSEKASLLPERKWDAPDQEEEEEDEAPRTTFRPRPATEDYDEEVEEEEEEADTYDRGDAVKGDFDEDEY